MQLEASSSLAAIFRKLITLDHGGRTAGMLEFRDIVEFRDSARLSKIPRSSLSPCPQSAPTSNLVAET